MNSTALNRRSGLEEELATELPGARIKRRGHLPEVAVRKASADVIPLGVVKGVVGFKSELESRTLRRGYSKFLKQGQVPVEETGTHD